jgi:hypothetical protein
MFSCPTYLLGGQYTSLRQMMFQPNFRYHVRVNLSHWPCLGSWASSRLRTAHSIMLSGIRSIQTPIFRVCFYFVCPAEVIMFFFLPPAGMAGPIDQQFHASSHQITTSSTAAKPMFEHIGRLHVERSSFNYSDGLQYNYNYDHRK